MTPQERGAAALQEMFSRFTPEARANAEALYNSNPDAITALGQRLLADEQALARRSAENDQFRTSLEQWQADERTRIEEARAAALAAAPAPREDPVADPVRPQPTDPRSRPVTVGELEDRERIYASVTAQLAELSVAHFAEFGERLDIQGMLRDPQIAQQGGVLGVYQSKFGERLQAKADARAEAAREQLREEGRQEVRTQAGANWPTPSAYQGDEEMSGLRGLSLTEEQKAARAASGDVIDRAAASYQALLHEKAQRAH